MAATFGGADLAPAYVIDRSPNGEIEYDAHFYFNPNGASANDSPVDIFTGLDQNGQPTFGVQFQTESATVFDLRGWVMQNGDLVYTQWKKYSTVNEEPEDIVNATHKIDVAWMSGASAGFSLYLDDTLLQTLTGDTSAYQLKEVLLGPSLGMDASASGTLYFDEFTSSRLNGVTFTFFMPVVDSDQSPVISHQ